MGNNESKIENIYNPDEFWLYMRSQDYNKYFADPTKYVREVAYEAIDHVIENIKHNWCRDYSATNNLGEHVSVYDVTAACFCPRGAVIVAVRDTVVDFRPFNSYMPEGYRELPYDPIKEAVYAVKDLLYNAIFYGIFGYHAYGGDPNVRQIDVVECITNYNDDPTTTHQHLMMALGTAKEILHPTKRVDLPLSFYFFDPDDDQEREIWTRNYDKYAAWINANRDNYAKRLLSNG